VQTSAQVPLGVQKRQDKARPVGRFRWLPIDYELDHAMPLAFGRHPTDLRNLALQPWDGPAKDLVEARVERLICTGHSTLAQGQLCFVDGWKTCSRH
jgi:hypothetical protein